jgi:hypothetical protein
LLATEGGGVMKTMRVILFDPDTKVDDCLSVFKMLIINYPNFSFDLKYIPELSNLEIVIHSDEVGDLEVANLQGFCAALLYVMSPSDVKAVA